MVSSGCYGHGHEVKGEACTARVHVTDCFCIW